MILTWRRVGGRPGNRKAPRRNISSLILFSLSLSSANSRSRFSFSILSSSILSRRLEYAPGPALGPVMESPGEGPGLCPALPREGEGRLLREIFPLTPRSFSSFSACFLSRSSRFLASLLSGTGLKYRSVLLQELPSPLFRCLTNIADCDL